MVEEIYMKDFKEKVRDSDCHTVLLVYQKDCEYCKMQEEIFEEFVEKYKGVINFYKIDGDESPDLLEMYDIVIPPTTLFFERGMKIYKSTGLVYDNLLECHIQGLFFE